MKNGDVGMVDIFYWINKLFFKFLILILPVEFINRLFYFLPGRLVVDILRWYGANIGENVKIMPPILVHNWQDNSKKPFEHLTIGKNTSIGRNAFFDLHGTIVIEENCTFAMDVMIVTHTNVGDIPIKKSIPSTIGSVVIRNGVYVGARSLIIATVEVGPNSAIGAGALVNRNIQPYALFAGVPAKMIRDINQDQGQ